MDTFDVESERPRMRRNIPFFFWAAERAKAEAKQAHDAVVTVLRRGNDAKGGDTEPQTAA